MTERYDEQELDEQELKELVATLEPSDFELDTPPPDLWSRIERDVDLSDEAAQESEVIPLHSRLLSPRILLAAAAVILLIGAGLAIALNAGSDDDGTVLAMADLGNDGLPVVNPDSGEAVLVEVDGALFLDVTVPDLPAAEGFFEIWVIDTDVAGMHSLGIVTGSGRFPLPSGVDPQTFPIVDISVEPVDGDPTHSGQSIWRGQLNV